MRCAFQELERAVVATALPPQTTLFITWEPNLLLSHLAELRALRATKSFFRLPESPCAWGFGVCSWRADYLPSVSMFRFSREEPCHKKAHPCLIDLREYQSVTYRLIAKIEAQIRVMIALTRKEEEQRAKGTYQSPRQWNDYNLNIKHSERPFALRKFR